MNTDKDIFNWLNGQFIAVEVAFRYANLDDKLDALQMLSEITGRVKNIVEAQLALSEKPYASKYVAPWKSTNTSKVRE